ncbi:MAG: ATP-dependent RNA helicase [Gammaproteobacteria bacterium]|nr:MAG: ATP-dependent RNA helicase [Gammaproteobacteria bacterium]
MSFSTLGLSEPLLRAVEEKGYTTPSPIQLEAIPAVLTGKDVMAAAQTGTGKTASFTLPLLHLLEGGSRVRANHIRALVLTPTRELAAQVHDNVVMYGKHLSLRSAVVFGGVKINPQMMKLRKGVDVLVATPGRLMDLYNQNAVNFSDVEILVLDEADRMLDMGFINDIRKIMALMPKKRQNLLFSATFSGEIRTLATKLLNDPIQVEISPKTTTAEGIKQSMFEVDKTQKTALLIHLIGSNNWNQVLVFMRTKHGCNRLVKKLEQFGITAAAIHGNKSQGARTRALAEFKSNKIRVLVATDIAARGIDISELPHVINFELPNVPEDYVHRIGRTGRAGSEGEAISLVSADEVEFLSDIENLIRQTLARDVEQGFVPLQGVPLTKLGTPRSSKAKKPRRSGNGGNGAARSGSGQRKEPAANRNRRGNNANSSGKPAHAGQRRSRKPAAK